NVKYMNILMESTPQPASKPQLAMAVKRSHISTPLLQKVHALVASPDGTPLKGNPAIATNEEVKYIIDELSKVKKKEERLKA
ncbi:MAG: hypothetical protein QW582_02710, partial [Candidatus Micrarchaeaceae archaeon]